MRIVLDSGAFWHPSRLRTLAGLDSTVIVPAVAFTERARRLQIQGVPVEEFEAWLAVMRFEVEPYGRVQAKRFATKIRDRREWARLARDAMIAGHLEPGDELWTTNPRDFERLGVAREQIVAIA